MPANAPPGFATPIRCGACHGLVCWMRDGTKNGDPMSLDSVRQPDGKPMPYGKPMNCPECQRAFGGIDVAMGRTTT